MKPLWIALPIVFVAVAAWLVAPRWQESMDRSTACRAVIDQARRQIKDPGFATFPDCNGTLDDPNSADIFVFRDAESPDIWHVTAKYNADISGDGDIAPIRFTGDAWRTLDGWEADVFVFERIN